MYKFIIILLMFSSVLNAQEVLDEIVAIVDNEIITKSELDFRVDLFAAQRKLNSEDPQLKKQVLDAMIEEKLVYAQAFLDSVTVSEDEVNQRINYQIDLFTQQYGSITRVEEIYGMSIERIKRELRDDVRKSIMTQKMQEKNFAFVEASRREVEEFYNKFKDSLGVIPEKVKISHIYRNPKASDRIKKEAYNLAKSLLDSINKGADFAELAKEYSEDPGSAAQGGDLGFVKRGVFYPEFESAAFALDEGELSSVVESPVGFHIIQLLEKRGETIHTRHILVKIKADEQADLRTIEFLSDIRDSIIAGEGSFASYARKYSEDPETKAFGGDLGTYYLNQLDKPLLDAVSKLKEGEISFPKRIDYGGGNYGYHIVYLEQRTPQHQVDLEKDYQELKRLADDYKKQQLYSEWIDKLKDKIYWDIRL